MKIYSIGHIVGKQDWKVKTDGRKLNIWSEHIIFLNSEKMKIDETVPLKHNSFS